MKYILSLVFGLLFSCHSFGQVNTNYIDSLSTTMLDIKDELVTIKDNYYMIMPYGIAGNIGVYVGKGQIILIDDQMVNIILPH